MSNKDKVEEESYLWKKVKNFIVTTIGVVSGILGIFSFVGINFDIKFKNLNLVLDLKFLVGHINGFLAIITMTICVCCISFLHKEKMKNKLMRDQILLQYNRILAIIQKWFLANWCKGNGNSREIVFKIISEIKDLFMKIYNKTVNVQVKTIQGKCTAEAYIQTLCSTQGCSRALQEGWSKIKDNSDFFELVEKVGRYFSFSIKDKKRKGTYISSNPHWRMEYSSSLVIPIKKANENGMVDIVGFLCLYSLATDAFNEDVKKLMLSLLETITGYLYLILELGIK